MYGRVAELRTGADRCWNDADADHVGLEEDLRNGNRSFDDVEAAHDREIEMDDRDGVEVPHMGRPASSLGRRMNHHVGGWVQRGEMR